MANYEISTTNFNVTQEASNEYSIGLNYEAPSKGIQYQNLILDDLSSQFDGVQTCLLYTSPSPRDRTRSRMPSSA